MTDARTVTVPEAARILGKTPDAVRGLVRRGTLTATRGNDGRPRVLLPDGRAAGAPAGQPPPDGPAAVETGTTGATTGRDGSSLLAELRGGLDKAKLETLELQRQVSDLRVELATARGEAAAANAVVAELRVQVEREIARGDALGVELAEARRPWWRRWIS